ncbi:MAG: hypothetical protein AAGI38_18180 [Bacteroidota bacterium]
MKYFVHILFTFLMGSVLVTACGPAEKELQDKLMGEVMAVHDEVMPKMGQIHELEKAVGSKITMLTADSTAIPDSAMLATLQQVATNLKNADDGMMNWMREFEKPDPATQSHEEIMEYLTGEMVKVEEVKTSMLSAIEEANGLVSKQP